MNNTLFKADFIPFYKDKTILITGSVGTVGSELLKQIAAYKPAEIRLFDNQESGLFMQMQACRNGAKAIPI
jgi:FlaA1/EpsC-like NDP-sugar epimerase